MFTITRQNMRLGAIGLVLAAGTTWSTALLADPGNSEREAEASARARENTPECAFHRATDLLSMSVANANREAAGEIEDFVFDRGTGRIEYALVKSGSVLGVGGRTIAVPYAQLGYDPAPKRFLLNMTPEQIERSGRLVPENWRDLERTTWEDDLDSTPTSVAEDSAPGRRPEPTVQQWTAAREERVTGTITSVRRDAAHFGEDQIVVTVRTDDGASRDVTLGPAWYVMGQNAAPMRGNKIDVSTRALNMDNTQMCCCTHGSINGEKVTFRDKEFHPAWRPVSDEHRSSGTTPREYEKGTGRLMLLTDLLGASARALNEDGGEVQEAIIEGASGRIAMIGFDPNDNILGMGDTIRCVPWAVLSVRDDEVVTIDATKEMLQASHPMPQDVAVFCTPTQIEPVYRSFDTDVYRFTPQDARRSESAATASEADRCSWIDASRLGKEQTITGKVVSVDTLAISPGEPTARILTIETNGTRKSIVLGPSSYVDRQSLDLNNNPTVTVSGRTVAMHGKDYLVARTVTINGTAIKLWNGDQPAWAAR